MTSASQSALVAALLAAAAFATPVHAQDWLPKVELSSLAEGNKTEVSDALQRVKDAPEDPEAVGGLGVVYFGYKFNRAAAVCFAHAAELDDEPFRWLYYTALSHRRAQDVDEAIAAFERALGIDDTYAPAHIELADVVIDADAERARKHYARALELDKKAAAAHAGLGRCAAILGETDAAIEHFGRALALKRNYGIVHYELAMLLRGEGRMDEAAEHLRMYQAAGPKVIGRDPLKRALRGQIRVPAVVGSRVSQLWGEKKFDEALALLDELLEKDPNQDAYRDLLARTYMRQGELAQAELQFRTILVSRPSYLDSIVGLAEVLERLERPKEAEAVLREALERHPDNGELLHRLALALANMRREHEALEFIRRAAKAQPGDAVIRLHYSRLLGDDGDDEGALREVRVATELDPRFAEAWEELGTSLESSGDAPGAESAWSRALELDYQRTHLYSSLARTMSARLEFKKLEAILRAGVKRTPRAPRIARELGWLLATCTDPVSRNGADAVVWATKACELTQFNRHSYLDTLAAAYAEADRFDEAVATEKRAIERLGTKRPDVLRAYRERLALYESGRPFRLTK